MILSFADKRTEKVWKGEHSKEFPYEIQIQGRKKLRMLNNAKDVDDLRSPPGNKLEQLKGDRKGQFSIRINDQWRICFNYYDNNATNVKIVDYH